MICDNVSKAMPASFLRAARIQISRYVEIDIALGKVVIRHWLVKAHVILPDDTADMVVG